MIKKLNSCWQKRRSIYATICDRPYMNIRPYFVMYGWLAKKVDKYKKNLLMTNPCNLIIISFEERCNNMFNLYFSNFFDFLYKMFRRFSTFKMCSFFCYGVFLLILYSFGWFLLQLSLILKAKRLWNHYKDILIFIY